MKWSLLMTFQLARTYLSSTPLTIDIYLLCLTLPISARYTRYQSAVRIPEQPQIYLPWFSWIRDRRREATEGSPFVHGQERKVERCTRSAARYLVGFTISAYILATDDQFCLKGFVLFLTKLDLYCHWNRNSLRRRGREEVSIAPSFFSFKSQINYYLQYLSSRSLPSLMIWWIRPTTCIKMTKSIAKLRRNMWKKKFRKPLYGYKFPPRAHVCFEGKCW